MDGCDAKRRTPGTLGRLARPFRRKLRRFLLLRLLLLLLLLLILAENQDNEWTKLPKSSDPNGMYPTNRDRHRQVNHHSHLFRHQDGS